jgi:hypothetical protein
MGQLFYLNHLLRKLVIDIQWNLRTKNEFRIEPNRISSIFSRRTALNLFELFYCFFVSVRKVVAYCGRNRLNIIIIRKKRFVRFGLKFGSIESKFNLV